MKRFIVAAGFAAAAITPAGAGALPPTNSGVPLGSTAGCLVIATPALPATCNFIGTGSGGLDTAGFVTGTVTVSHQRKVAVCTDHSVSGFTLIRIYDAAPPDVSHQGPWAASVIFTVTANGEGFVAVGSPQTPGGDMTSEPTVGPAPGYAGAEDGTDGARERDPCGGES